MDLGLLFYRRWRLFLLVFLGITALAAVFAFLRSERYAYQTTIEIGSQVLVNSAGNTEVVLIESPSTVLAKVTESYIPNVVGELAKSEDTVKITARVPKDSYVVVLQSEGPPARADLYARLHRAVTERLLEDHASRFAVVIKNLQNQRAEVLAQAASAEDEAQALEAQFKRMDAVAQLLDEQIQTLRSALETSATHADAVDPRQTEAALGLLMLSNEAQQYREELRLLEARRVEEIPQQRYELYRALADAQRRQENLERQAEGIQLRLEELDETHVLSISVPSQAPVGTSSLILALGVFLALFAAVFAVLVSEFARKVRAKQATGV